MSLENGKHIVKKVDGTLCTIVEADISAVRMKFLKELLELNNFELKTEEASEEDGQPTTWTIGVTDLVFNPVIAVYEKSLKKPNGRVVTPAYWKQEPEIDHLPYFNYRKRNPKAKNDDDFDVNPWGYRTV